MQRRWAVLAIIFSSWLSNARASEARLAIIIDDIGYNQIQSLRAAHLPGNFTLAILPFTPYGFDIANLAHRQGKELMLHLPMSNLKNMPLGKGGLHGDMNRETLVSTLRTDLSNLPHIKGINNHMGSRLTQESQPMQWLMEEVRAQGLYFIDSRTSAQTKALETAQSNLIPSAKRDVFLDDIEERSAIEYQLQRALAFARERGSAIAIGHPYPATMAVLEQIQPQLAKAQVSLVFASQLVTIGPLTARLTDKKTAETSLAYCPALPRFMWPDPPTKVDLYDITDTMANNLLVIK